MTLDPPAAVPLRSPRWLTRGRLGGLLSASERGAILWAAGGMEEHDWGAPRPAWSRALPCVQAAASPDLRAIALLTPAGLLLLSTPGGALPAPIPARPSGPLAVASRRGLVAFVSLDGALVVRSREEPLFTRALPAAPLALAFAPDASLLACACEAAPGRPATLLLLDLTADPPGALLACIDLAAPASGLIVSPRGLVAAIQGRAVRFWTLDGHAAGELDTQPGAPSALALDPSADRLAVGYRGGPIALWNFPLHGGRGTYAGAVDGHRGTVRALVFVAGGAGLASAADDQQVALWGLPGARARHQRQPGTRGIEALVASPDGRRWLAAHEDGSASIPSRDGDLERTLGHHPGGCHAAAWSPDGAVLATGGADGLVRLWGARRGDLRAEGKAPGAVQSLVFAGENLFVGGEAGLGRWPLPLAARVPSLGLGALRLTPIPGAAIEEHLTGCRALATQGEAVAVASDGGQAFLGDGKRRWRPLTLHRGALWSLAFAPDGALLACGEEGAVTLHDARFAERLVRIEVPGGRLWSLAFAPDGQRLAAACQDGLVRVVGLQSGRVEEELSGHTDEVTAVHWAPDDTLHSAGRDGALIRWERRAPGARDLSASVSAGGARPGSG